MKKHLRLFLFLLSTYSMAQTDPKVAHALVLEGRGVMIDVREVTEIEFGMIDVAMWFPLSWAKENPSWFETFLPLIENKEKIFIYCRSGRRSEEFRELLLLKGIDSENLGGFENLKDILPVVIPKES